MILEAYGDRPAGRALDIGCAVPYSLGQLRAKGWSVVGTDPSPRVAELGRELYGVEVKTGIYDPEMFRGEAPFDLVIMSHVLEHVVSPAEVLRGVSQSLDRAGVFYIEVPNLLKPAVPFGYFTFEHLNYFTPTTLTALLAAARFEPVTLATFDNADGTWPFYPVIASAFRPAESPRHPGSDREAAGRAVAGYRDSSASEGQRLQERVDAIVASVEPGRLALWGAGIHTNQLLTLTRLDPSLIACVYDNDPKKQGRLLLGRAVRALPADPSEVARDVDAILISSRAFEAAIHQQISHLEDHGVAVYPLYRDRSKPETV
jgi:SAM-dependent methyltransferase